MKKAKEIFTGKTAILIAVTIVLSVAAILLQGYIWGPESIFYGTEIKNGFIKTIVEKTPAILASIIIIVASITLSSILKLITFKAFKKNNRVVTIMSLVSSLLKWVIFIIAALLILSVFGVDTTTLLASAGILTLVIGLGAQSLVADILAGFFLVFEGEYEVGDIISIDGWRGTVKDIGIRVTRLVDAGGNIKTINNSDVKNVINQTNELSLAKVIMPIDYGESLERVECILKDNFDKVKENIPAIVEGPFYKGISSLGASSVDLLFVAKCKEADLYQVQRDLVREFYLIFNKNNINVPFNQIVVSNREEPNEKPTKKEIKNAKNFVDDQNNLSKSIKEE